MEQEELRVQLASKEQLIHQFNVHLMEANHSQEKSKAEVGSALLAGTTCLL